MCQSVKGPRRRNHFVVGMEFARSQGRPRNGANPGLEDITASRYPCIVPPCPVTAKRLCLTAQGSEGRQPEYPGSVAANAAYPEAGCVEAAKDSRLRANYPPLHATFSTTLQGYG